MNTVEIRKLAELLYRISTCNKNYKDILDLIEIELYNLIDSEIID